MTPIIQILALAITCAAWFAAGWWLAKAHAAKKSQSDSKTDQEKIDDAMEKVTRLLADESVHRPDDNVNAWQIEIGDVVVKLYDNGKHDARVV